MQGICLTQNYDADVVVKKNALNQIVQGLVVGETIYQNEAIILSSHKGDIKEYPLIGVGIDDITNDNDTTMWESEISVNLSRDNMDVRTVSINRKTGKLTIDAEYK